MDVGRCNVGAMRRTRALLVLLAAAALSLVASSAGALDEKTEPRQALLDGYRLQTRIKSFRIRSTTAAKTTSTTVLEYVAPDRFRMVTERAETVVTPGATYVRYKGGRWAIAPVDVSELIARFREPKELKEIADPAVTKDFKALGPEILDGDQTFVYQYTSAPAEQAAVSKVWLLAPSGLPKKKEADSEYGSEKIHSTQVFEYDRDIKIEAPIY